MFVNLYFGEDATILMESKMAVEMIDPQNG